MSQKDLDERYKINYRDVPDDDIDKDDFTINITREKLLEERLLLSKSPYINRSKIEAINKLLDSLPTDTPEGQKYEPIKKEHKDNKKSFLQRLKNWCDDHEDGLKIIKYFILLVWGIISVETTKIVLAGDSNTFAKILAVVSTVGVAISVVISGLRMATSSNDDNK